MEHLPGRGPGRPPSERQTPHLTSSLAGSQSMGEETVPVRQKVRIGHNYDAMMSQHKHRNPGMYVRMYTTHRWHWPGERGGDGGG